MDVRDRSEYAAKRYPKFSSIIYLTTSLQAGRFVCPVLVKRMVLLNHSFSVVISSLGGSSGLIPITAGLNCITYPQLTQEIETSGIPPW